MFDFTQLRIPLDIGVIFFEVCAYILGLIALTWVGFWLWQGWADRMRTTYELQFPRGMTHAQVLDFVRSVVSELPRPSLTGPAYAISLEKYADYNGKKYFLYIPNHVKTKVDKLLSKKIPGISIEPVRPRDDLVSYRPWEVAVELTMAGNDVPLFIRDDKHAIAVAASIDVNFESLGRDEALVMQWVFTSDRPRRPGPNDKDKVSDYTLNAVARIAAMGEDSKQLVKDLGASLASVNSHGSAFRRRFMRGVPDRIHRRAATFQFPIYLNASEFTAIMGWPLDGLEGSHARKLPPDKMVDTEGIVIGSSDYPKTRGRLLAIPPLALMKHCWICGPSGCLHPDTPIYDPVDKTTKTVKQRYDKALPFHVFALDGESITITEALAPERYRCVPMYRLTNGHESITVTGQHRIWDGSRYVQCDELYARQEFAEIRLPSISDASLSRLQLDAQHSMRTVPDSLVGHHQVHHSCDAQPQLAVGTAQVSAPSQADVDEPYSVSFGKDDLVHTKERIHRHQPPLRFSRNNSSAPESPYPSVADVRLIDTSLSTCGIHPSAAGSPSGLIPGRKDPRTHKFELGSIVDARASEEALCRVSEDNAVPPDPICPSRQQPEYDLGPSLSLLPNEQSGPHVKPLVFPAIDYFDTSTYWVERVGVETYYDFHVPVLENYFAQGLFHHNTGKSCLLHNMAVQIMDQGMGLILIEPSGDLARDVLRSVPRHRAKDVIWFDPSDTEFPIGLNVLAGHDVDLTASHIEAMFHNIFHDSWGDRLARVLRLGVKTAAINGLTLYDVRHLLMNPEYRAAEVAKLRKQTRYHDLILEWRWLDSIPDMAVDSVINKLDNFLGSRTLRNILGQHGGINMADIVANQKILLVPLPSAIIGETNTAALGSLLRELLWDEIRRRPENNRPPIILMMDEFQNYGSLKTTQSDPFAEARKYGLGLVIANQQADQLHKLGVLPTVSANTGSKIIFSLEDDDSKHFKDTFAPLTAEELRAIPHHSVVARLMSSSGKAPVATALTAPPPSPTGAGHGVQAASRAAYARPVHEVELEFVERHKASTQERKRPSIGRVINEPPPG